MKRLIAGVAIAVLAGVGLAGCSQGGGDGKTVKVAYQKFGNFTQMDEQMKAVKKQFESENEGYTVELIPIQAAENDYYTKLSLMNKAKATAPDVMYEDTFLIKSDAAAGYLEPLDDYVADWEDWEQFPDSAKQAGVGEDGKTYGISMGTDTRAIWYNKDLLSQAGVEVPWEPKTWDDVRDAAEMVKSALPDVIPLNVYSGKAGGEQSTMQGFEMLQYGTDDTLYDESEQKWISGSTGFTDALEFVQSVYQGGLGPKPEQALDPNVGTVVAGTWIPEGKLAINIDGSWLSSNWIESGAAPWPEWQQTMGMAPMPTQDGQEPGATSMSGGWTLAMGSQSANKDAAWKFISLALNKDNSLAYAINATQIPVRSDVAEDPEYIDSNPTNEFFSSLVEVTHFRPATTVYPKVSNNIQVAMEAVMTGQKSPKEAAAAYDEALADAVGGDDNVAAAK